MVYVIFGVALIGAIIYVLRQNIEYGVYWGFVGLALFVVGLITKADIIGFPGLFLLFGSYYFVWKKKKEDSSFRSPTISQKTFSNNIYKAIEEFARLCYQCKARTDWAYDERDHGMIRVTNSSKGTKLEIECCGDCLACTLPAEYRWLYDDDNPNIIKYIAENVTGYVEETYGSVPTEGDSLFYFYKKGDPHAIGTHLWLEQNGKIVNIAFKLR